MSNVEAAVKVADQIITRIFDQRQFTSGEINYLTRELVEKSNLEDDFSKLLRTNLNLNVTLDTLDNEFKKVNLGLVEDVSNQLSSLDQQSKRLDGLEEELRQKEETLLAKRREERKKVCDDKRAMMDAKLKSFTDNLEAEELELERKYRKFEENLGGP